MIGILAYGSLIAEPGWEIEKRTSQTIVEVETPFAVEYARKSSTRSDAPTLVPVQDEKSWRVQSCILVLKPYTRISSAKNILYRREIHQIGNRKKPYVHSDHPKNNTTIIDELHKFKGIDLVLYTQIGVTIPEILAESLTDQEKAQQLAKLAIDSVTEETFLKCQDGIHYLATAMHYGVITRLTELYKQSILQLADNPHDLTEARMMVAKSKKIIP